MAPPPSYSEAYPTLTPYLQLPHLLSLTWLAYPILSLIFVAFRLQASLDTTESAIASAKVDLLASCSAAEQAATAAASMPRYMALATNQQFADAVNGSLNAARSALVLTLTVMEAIINFIIDLYRSIFFCFLELVVRGGLAILIGAVNELNSLISTVTSGLRTSIQNDFAAANSAITTAIAAINKLNPFGNITAPQLTVPSLDGLQNITLPSSFQDSLTQLNQSIPTASSIKDKIETLINTPFELLKKDINDTFATIQFNGTALPVPEQNRLSFCNQLDTSVVDDIGRDILKAFKIGIVILIVIALLLIGLNCALTWYKWRCMKNHLEYTRQAWMSDPTIAHTKGSLSSTPQVTLSDHNLMMLHANSSHPLVTRIANQMSSRFRLTPTQHTNMQWFFNYIFHPPAAACFLIGFFGLLMIEIQLAAMGPLVNKYQGQAADTARDFSLVIADSINQSMVNQSALYAQQVNAQVDAAQSTINDGVFGWVNTTTTQLNTTINAFYDDIQNAVTTVFGGSILEAPASEFIKCIIGSKVDAIESALTFLHDNLKVDMPRVSPNVLLLSPASVDEATAPIAAAALGGGADDNQGLVPRLVNSYANTLRKERVTFGIFLALWGFVVLMAIGVLLWHSYGLPLLERRRRRRYQLEQRSGNPNDFVLRDGIATPPAGGLKLTGDNKWDGGLAASQDLPQFTPLPSPRRSVFKPFWASRSNSPAPGSAEDAFDGEELKKQNGSLESWGQDVEKVSRLKAITMKLKNVGASKGDAENQRQDVEASEQSGWFGKFKGAFGAFGSKKEPEPEHNFWKAYNERPKLKIIVDTPSDMSYAEPQEEESHKPTLPSRWSTSPTEVSWKNLLSPSKKNHEQGAPTPAIATLAPPKPFIRTLPPPPGLRHKPSVPSDIGGSFDDPILGSATPPSNNPYINKPVTNELFIPPPAVYPIPLHSVYQGNNYPIVLQTPSPPPIVRRTPPPPPSLDSSPSTPTRSPSHRRVSSVPVWRITNFAPSDQISVSSSNASLPEITATSNANRSTVGSTVTPPRALVPGHPRHPGVGNSVTTPVGAVNPFITPFDDEHRVEIVAPERRPRKSMMANPFETTGFAF